MIRSTLLSTNVTTRRAAVKVDYALHPFLIHVVKLDVQCYVCTAHWQCKEWWLLEMWLLKAERKLYNHHPQASTLQNYPAVQAIDAKHSLLLQALALLNAGFLHKIRSKQYYALYSFKSFNVDVFMDEFYHWPATVLTSWKITSSSTP